MLIRRTLLICLGLTGLVAGSCEPLLAQGIPDSPTGKVAKALARFAATTGDDALREFLDERVAPSARDEALSGVLRAFREKCPRAEIRGADKTGSWEATIEYGSSAGSCRVSYTVDSKAPHGVIALSLDGQGRASAGGSQCFGSQSLGERGPLIDGFVLAFNSGDADRMMKFYEESATDEFQARRTQEEDLALYQRLWDELGRLESPRVAAEGDGKVRLTAEAGNLGEAVTFVMDLTSGSSPRIKGFSVNIGGPPAGGDDDSLPAIAVPENADGAQAIASVDSYLQELADDGVFSGSVLVSRGERVVFEGFYGLANREDEIPVTAKTRFDIGSITKDLTKAAIGQLARDGKLAVDDRLIEHLPDYPDRSAASKITIAQLLSHRSGLGDIFNERFENTPKERLQSPRDFFPIFTGVPLRFEPGTGRQYSNAGYIVLGAIVESASGMPYVDYLQKHIFEPAGMMQSGFPVRDGSVPELAIGYTERGAANGELQRNLGMLPIRGCPAGSSSHTAADLHRFDRALRGGKLLGPGWTDWFFTGTVPTAKDLEQPVGYAGYGIGIAGGGSGVNAMVESGERGAIIVLANLDPPIAGRVAARLREVSQLTPE